MLKSTLEQMQNLSTQMQQNIKKALTLQQHTHKIGQPSPATHYNSNKQRTGSIPANRGYEKVSASERQPYQPAYREELEPLEIKPFMAGEENQLLKSEIEELKAKNRQYRQQIRQIKRYVKFLEEYNDDLKKQVVLWMTRPAKKQPYVQELTKNINDLRTRFHSTIVSKSTPITNHKSILINQSTQLHQHPKVKFANTLNPQHNYLSQSPPSSPSSTTSSKLNHKLRQSFKKSKQKEKANKSANLESDNICTSCNYLQHRQHTNDLHKSNTRCLHKNKLAGSLQLEAYTYGKNKGEGIVHNHKGEGIVHNHKGEGIVHNHKGEGIVHNHKGEGIVHNHQHHHQRNGGGKSGTGLCECHRKYVKEGKF